jgi:hypothetical protein
MHIKKESKLGTGGLYLSSQAIREAKISRIKVLGQPRQKVHKTLSQNKRLVVMACGCHPNYHKYK